MKRRKFIRNAAIATAATTIGAPYILPTGRLFAQTGNRIANHVVFVLFAGGIRQQESIEQQYLANQGMATQGNVMNNMLAGAAPTNNLVYQPWTPIQTTPLASQGTLFKEVAYQQGTDGALQWAYRCHDGQLHRNGFESQYQSRISNDF